MLAGFLTNTSCNCQGETFGNNESPSPINQIFFSPFTSFRQISLISHLEYLGPTHKKNIFYIKKFHLLLFISFISNLVNLYGDTILQFTLYIFMIMIQSVSKLLYIIHFFLFSSLKDNNPVFTS